MGTLRAILFDWGDTLMRDYPEVEGPMASWPRVAAVAGVREALEVLHHHYVCAVASNAGSSDAELMGTALERVGLKRYFSYLFTSKELGARKPDVSFFERTLERMGVEASECIMVGNEYAKDIVPAKSVGMLTVLLSSGESGPCADCTIASMGGLVDAVRLLDGKSGAG